MCVILREPSFSREICTMTSSALAICSLIARDGRSTAEPRAVKKEGQRVPLFGSKDEVHFALSDGAVRTHDRIRFAILSLFFFM